MRHSVESFTDIKIDYVSLRWRVYDLINEYKHLRNAEQFLVAKAKLKWTNRHM